MVKNYNIFKALADKTRLSIATVLAKDGEMSCRQLSAKFRLSQPTLSHHFSRLADAGVILERKAGVSHYYSINSKLLKKSGINLKAIRT